MNSRSASKVKIAGFDDLFGNKDESEDKVIEVPLSVLHPFNNHPFYVEDDKQMDEMVDSIKEYGVLVPGLARVRENGEYELISGHRRKHACELVGNETMPVIIKNMTDDEATIAMVDSNIQRENLLYSEKAFALKLKFEAMKHQGTKGAMNTTDMIGESIGESGRQVQRYIRLTYLHPGILKMLDIRKISFIPAVNLSYLDLEKQEWVINAINLTGKYPSNKQVNKIKESFEKEKLTQNIVLSIINEQKTKDYRVIISSKRIKEYFDDSFSLEEIENIIIQQLDKWKNNQ